MATRDQTPYRFFYAHGAYGWNKKVESRDAGRRRMARTMSAAEAWARENASAEWSIDHDADDSRVGKGERYPLYQCVLYRLDDDGQRTKDAEYLGGIDLGAAGIDPRSERLVEAQLALEMMRRRGEIRTLREDG